MTKCGERLLFYLESNPNFRMKLDILCFFALSLISASLAAVVNEEVTRTVDASTAMVKITTDIKVEGSGKEYSFYVPNSQANHVAYISAAAKGKKGKAKGRGYKLSAPVIDDDHKEYTKYIIFVDESSPTIRVKMILTDLLEPYPAEITQSDNPVLCDSLTIITFIHLIVQHHKSW